MDLCGMMVLLGILVLVALPALANSRARADRIACANNLRQIGTGVLLWAHEHDDAPPFDIPVTQGGTRRHLLSANTWLHFSWLSNQLSTPRLFLCPSDSGVPARDFTGNPASGYLHPNFANRATSYFIAHASFSTPAAVLAGDRNIRTGAALENCSRFNGALISSPNPSIGLAWVGGLHGAEGNLLLFDGQVAQADPTDLRKLVFESGGTESAGLHYIAPR